MTGSASTFGFTGTIESFVVPVSGDYYIVAYGAQGGGGGSLSGGAGGYGAEIGGEFNLTANEVLTIAIGGAGGSGPLSGGGGGGSFVVGPDNTPLVIAGGGGGGGFEITGDPGQTGTSGGTPITGSSPGGTAGAGGASAVFGGGGGGGFLGNGATSGDGSGGGEGYPSLAGGAAGASDPGGFYGSAGGFGGGGGSDDGSGGGGGGYSGGGGSQLEGAGGGSIDNGSGQILIAGENSGNGYVVIVPVAAPTIAGTVANQAITGQPDAHAFDTVTIDGLPVTITVTPSGTAYGTLTDPLGGTVGSDGSYTVTGSPSTVTADLQALTFTPTPAATLAPGQTFTTGFTISAVDVLGETSSDAVTSVVEDGGLVANFDAIGAFTTFTVPETGLYDIVAYGAQGGPGGSLGGLGAEIGGYVTLTAGEVLTLSVGGQGGQGSGTSGGAGGGGGGSFVLAPGGTPLMIAGGGGGGSSAPRGGSGGGGLTSTSGGAGDYFSGGVGGTAGLGGGGTPSAGGGGGLYGAGGSGGATGGAAGGGAGGAGTPRDSEGDVGGDGGWGGGGGGRFTIGGGGGGYSGGGGGGFVQVYTGGGGGSFDSGTNQVLIGSENAGNGLITITLLEPPTITGTQSGQATSNNAPINPFTNVGISERTPGLTDTVTVTLSDPVNGTLSDFVGGTVSNGVYTVTGSAIAVTAALEALTFTPAAFAPIQTITTGFTISDTNSADLTTADATSTVIDTVLRVASIISGTAANQQTTNQAPINPFAGVTIVDPNPGSPTETVTVTPINTANGTLSDLAGGTVSGGVYTVTGSANEVSTDLEALTFTPAASAANQTITTGFTVSDTNSNGFTTADSTTSVVDTLPAVASTINGVQSSQTTLDTTPINPFAHVTITDPNLGGTTQTVTVALNNIDNGTLSDPLGGAVGQGVYTVTGSTSTVTADLEALIFTPAAIAPGQTVTTQFTISDTNSNSLTAIDTASIAVSPPVAADFTSFSNTGSIVNWTVPSTGVYEIVAGGGQGGDSYNDFGNGQIIASGGFGARIGGDFTLTADEVLAISVGGQGERGPISGGLAGGGGGGSFVLAPGGTPLIIAGGGGGAGGDFNNGEISSGTGGLATDGGGAGLGYTSGFGGTGGAGGGGGGQGGGGGGGGLNSAGAPGLDGFAGGGAAGGAAGGTIISPLATGGWGGGGAGYAGGGGGGGYSGGGGGGIYFDFAAAGGGGGGGSFDSGTNQILFSNAIHRDGGVSITLLVDPTIAGTQANQANIGQAAIQPFATVTITDSNPGSPNETVTVTPSDTANGTLSDLAGGTVGDDGVYTVTGSAEMVTADLQALTFAPAAFAPGQTITTGFTISDTDAAGLTATDTATGVVDIYAADVPCFCAGTRIATEHGDVAVETLEAGQRVLTLSGEARSVTWIGRRRIALGAHPRPESVAPIRIQKHAFAGGLPRRDLFVSPDHAIYIDGKLVSARRLVNGMTIRRETSWTAVEYFHLELATHDILLAEGLPTESYLETGNRGMFQNTRLPVLLHPDLTNDQMRRQTQSCAPFANAVETVEPIWRALADRAHALGLSPPDAPGVTDDSSMRLMVDGVCLNPVSVSPTQIVFMLPRPGTDIRLISRSAVPADLRPWVADCRRLGVMLGGLTWRSGDECVPVPLDYPGLTDGWWDSEWHTPTALRRWTDGNAVVPPPGWLPGPWILEVSVAGSHVYSECASATAVARHPPKRAA